MKRRRNVMSKTQLLQFRILIGLAIVSLLLIPWKVARDDIAGLRLNLGTELCGAVATYIPLTLFIGNLLRREESKREAEELKRELILTMRTGGRDNAAIAVAKLRERGWLTDGSLKGKMLSGAELQELHLIGANLQGVSLRRANLQEAFLSEANLQGALLQDTAFDDETILPDDTKWTPDTDLTRFTDPAHPDFWRSDDPRSPAYRGRTEEAPEA